MSRLAQAETAGTAAWLLMDLFWMLEWPGASSTMGGLALALFLLAFRWTPRTAADLCANGAVVCWVVMNLCWMVGDQYEIAGLKNAALASIALSIALLAVGAWYGGLNALARFRRLRMGRGGAE